MKRIEEGDGISAFDAALGALTAGQGSLGRGAIQAPRATIATAVRFTLQALADDHPGHSVEVRVPPYGAVQCIEGPRHTRGTPPNVIETDAATWLALVSGRLRWPEALASGLVDASGARAHLDGMLPIPGLHRVRRGRPQR
ncbi:sterol carrier family protein [Pseudoclavibacter sp. 13-3]|uniref:sterol carrier family protein n=1 Tax=Pseudoclavibacter sp. 13-3 TaxID=2901228 RepID=UPI001E4AC012|nr:sterol carrier family protein [Pseudoclavibacter sp. 13-3]MCD7101468.1 sterol carrier family protein [Pseudoclavibacter sp. 13-3]